MSIPDRSAAPDDFAAAVPPGGSHEPVGLHLLDHSGRPRVADLETALEQRGRGTIVLPNDLDGIRQQAVGFLVFSSAVGQRATHVLDRVRDAPADITLVALVLVVLLVIATKAWTGRGTPLRGGLPSGHAAIAFAGWIAVTYLVGDHHRFVVSALTLIMALLVAQTRVESGIHSLLEVFYGGAVGALTTLIVFQLIG